MSKNTSMLTARIVIERRMNPDDGFSVTTSFEDGHDGMPNLVEVLGMLELAKDTAIRLTMGEACE